MPLTQWVPDVSDQEFNEALADIYGHSYGHGEFTESIKDVLAIWQGKDKQVAACQSNWGELIGNVGALAFLATTAGASEKEREILFRIIEFWAKTPMAREPEKFRVAIGCEVEWDEMPIEKQQQGHGLGRWKDSNYYLKVGYPKSFLIEHATDGKFQDLRGVKEVEDEWQCTVGFGGPERLAQVSGYGSPETYFDVATRDSAENSSIDRSLFG